MSVNYFVSLFAHQAWADACLLSSVQAHPPSLEDEWLLKTLHHIVSVQRYFLFRFLNLPFDPNIENQPPASFADLVHLYRATHIEELAFVRGISEADFERTFDLPFLKARFSLADGIIQIAMHSQNHRGQCLRYLRKQGGEAPTLDYILWAKDRPGPEWPKPAPAPIAAAESEAQAAADSQG